MKELTNDRLAVIRLLADEHSIWWNTTELAENSHQVFDSPTVGRICRWLTKEGYAEKRREGQRDMFRLTPKGTSAFAAA